MTTGEEGLRLPSRVINALNEHLQRQPQRSQIKQNIAGAYYDGELTFTQLESLVGDEEAENFRVLKDQLNEEFPEELAEKSSSDATPGPR